MFVFIFKLYVVSTRRMLLRMSGIIMNMSIWCGYGYGYENEYELLRAER